MFRCFKNKQKGRQHTLTLLSAQVPSRPAQSRLAAKQTPLGAGRASSVYDTNKKASVGAQALRDAAHSSRGLGGGILFKFGRHIFFGTPVIGNAKALFAAETHSLEFFSMMADPRVVRLEAELTKAVTDGLSALKHDDLDLVSHVGKRLVAASAGGDSSAAADSGAAQDHFSELVPVVSQQAGGPDARRMAELKQAYLKQVNPLYAYIYTYV